MLQAFWSRIQLNRLYRRRCLVLIMGLLVQCVVLGLLIVSLSRRQEAVIVLKPVVGQPGICRLELVAPFSRPWGMGYQAGDLVKVLNADSQDQRTCTSREGSLQLQGLRASHDVFEFKNSPQTVNKVTWGLSFVLALIFDVAAITIFLRAQDRPTAQVAYALFTESALLFYLLPVEELNIFWIQVATFILAMLTRGLSTTFVCLFPRPSRGRSKYTAILPYLPLLIGIVLALVGLPLLMLAPAVRVAVFVSTLLYNIACVIVVLWVLLWGVRSLDRSERHLARMVVVGMAFLLLPLVLSLGVVNFKGIWGESSARLLLVPLAVLPIACDYAMFRRQLLGTTSLISRQVMRLLLWLLLASIFIFPCLLLFNGLDSSGFLKSDMRDYVYAGVLILCFCLFPLTWSKVRDVGDQVLYHDFYQYNRSLRELSAAVTRLQGLEQISAYILPRLAALLNTSDIALLVREEHRNNSFAPMEGLSWQIYRQKPEAASLEVSRLIGVAQLALTHPNAPNAEPLMLDGILLFGLYRGDELSGFLCVGPKFNLEPYSRQDLSFLGTLVAQLSVLEVNSRYLNRARSDAQKLSALNHRVMTAQEEERRHLALELHDEALQQAMLLVRQLSDASSMIEVAEAMPVARSIVSSLRHTCLELRPPLLDELGLEEALSWLAQDTEQRGKVDVHFIQKGVRGQRQTPDVELTLYRIMQEALANILKHARASQITIRLHRSESGSCSLLICDNGRGFQRSGLQAERLGLIGMHERMGLIGGKIQLRSSLGRGVAVRAVWPHRGEDALPLRERAIHATV